MSDNCVWAIFKVVKPGESGEMVVKSGIKGDSLVAHSMEYQRFCCVVQLLSMGPNAGPAVYLVRLTRREET
jgi:hypothetical protein